MAFMVAQYCKNLKQRLEGSYSKLTLDTPLEIIKAKLCSNKISFTKS